MEEVNIKIARLEKDVEKIISEQKEMKQSIKVINKLASSVEVMANEVKHMNVKIDNISSKVELHHTEEPNQLMNNVKKTIITGIVSALVGAIVMLVLK